MIRICKTTVTDFIISFGSIEIGVKKTCEVPREYYLSAQIVETPKMSDIKKLKKELEKLKNCLVTCNVAVDEPVNVRFAEFFGLEKRVIVQDKYIMQRSF